MKSIRKIAGRRGGARVMLVLAMVSTLAGIGLTSGTASASKSKTKLVVGGIFPFTGTKSLLSSWGTHGVAVGVYEINHNGGVLGDQLKSVYVDDAADSVDVLPAFRKLELSHPKVIVGPFSPTIEGIINQFQPNDVVDFMVG